MQRRYALDERMLTRLATGRWCARQRVDSDQEEEVPMVSRSA
jgi:hypothetical protein